MRRTSLGYGRGKQELKIETPAGVVWLSYDPKEAKPALVADFAADGDKFKDREPTEVRAFFSRRHPLTGRVVMGPAV